MAAVVATSVLMNTFKEMPFALRFTRYDWLYLVGVMHFSRLVGNVNKVAPPIVQLFTTLLLKGLVRL